jgi:hypothetical protein
MDLGDWQEMSRLRSENHAWHRCIEAILGALDEPGATSGSIAEAVDRSLSTLNDRLTQLRRRAVPRRAHR